MVEPQIYALSIFIRFAFLLGLCAAILPEKDATAEPTRMHIAVFSIPLYGHFMPVKALAEELLSRNHKVTLFVEDEEWCRTCSKNSSGANMKFQCVTLDKSGTFGAELFEELSASDAVGESFSALFTHIVQHHTEQLPSILARAQEVHRADPISLVFLDLSTIVGFSVSSQLNVPYVSFFPLTLHMPLGPATYLPSLGTQLPSNGRMSIMDRWGNFLLKLLVPLLTRGMVEKFNEVRMKHSIPPIQHIAEIAGMKGLIFTPSVWGYDVPHPLCPNIVPLGAFSPCEEHAPLEREVKEFLDACQSQHQPVVYVNFGTLSVVGHSTFSVIVGAMRALPSYCFIGKFKNRTQIELLNAEEGLGSRRVYFQSRFANPIAIMNHPQTHAFLSHCGDTSVLEAIQAELPIAGIPFFADQGDVCMRIDEAMIGMYVGHKKKFTTERLVRVLTQLVEQPSRKLFKSKLSVIRNVSKFLGGAKRGADLIEARYSHGLLQADSFFDQCQVLRDPFAETQSTLLRLQEYDVVLLTIVWIFLLILAVRWIGIRIFGLLGRVAWSR